MPKCSPAGRTRLFHNFTFDTQHRTDLQSAQLLHLILIFQNNLNKAGTVAHIQKRQAAEQPLLVQPPLHAYLLVKPVFYFVT